MKFLAKSPTNQNNGRPTLALNDWIVKLNDDDHPHIILIEYFGMLAARAAGLTVPEVHLSADRKHLLIKRFDLKTENNHLGFEDMCSVLGLPARDKFTGSVERMIKSIRLYCYGAQVQTSYDHFFGQYVLASTIRNGDAHLKNFGLIYDSIQSAVLAPVYDMLSMSVYAPRCSNSNDADDGMAINFEGSKRWLTSKTIKALASQCMLTTKQSKKWEERIADALVAIAAQVIEFVGTYPEDDFAIMARRMLELWSCGLDAFDSQAAQTIRENAQGLGTHC